MSRILITGGSGTFGRTFVRRCLAHNLWDGVISYSRDEQKASQLVEEFADYPPFKAFLGDVRDPARLSMAMRGVTHVVHAAALKRVDVGAYSPSEIKATNIDGTANVVDAAIRAGVSRVVVISSDKAVQPTNIYGASKMFAETYAVQANNYGFPSGTQICAVRYGNILGSRGSAVHIWRKQAATAQPLTITDANMTRFVMTIEQAVDLVLYALRNMQAGEVFIPKLPAASVVDLALACAPHDDYPTTVVGWRPGGEKVAEFLLNNEETFRTRMVDEVFDYYAVAPSHHEWTPTGHIWHGSNRTCDGWRYASDTARRLSIDGLRKMLAETEALR